MLSRWKKLSSRIIDKNPWWSYTLDSFKIPDGIEGKYYYVHTEGSSMVVPVLDDGRIVLVNQYRYLCDRESVEFPCGGVKPEHRYDEMARIELEEEAGYLARSLDLVGEFNPFNGVTDEICKVFIARGLTKVQAKPESTEEFEMIMATPGEIDSMISKNVIWDGMTLAAWMLARKVFDDS